MPPPGERIDPTVVGKEMTDSVRNGGGTVDQALEFVKASSRRPNVARGPWVPDFDSPLLQDQSMISREPSPLLEPLLGQVVVVDLKSSYVCLGTLVACDEHYLELRDADLHDFRDSAASREVYVYDSVRLGIRRNRERVLIRQDDVVAISRFGDISES
jgi:small nuclear ribonucleoprotein (snRNP)-like protein